MKTIAQLKEEINNLYNKISSLEEELLTKYQEKGLEGLIEFLKDHKVPGDFYSTPALDMAIKKEENPEEFRNILFNLIDSNNPFSEANDVNSFYSYREGFIDGFKNILTYENL